MFSDNPNHPDWMTIWPNTEDNVQFLILIETRLWRLVRLGRLTTGGLRDVISYSIRVLFRLSAQMRTGLALNPLPLNSRRVRVPDAPWSFE